MESSQVADPPDMNKVTLRILGNDLKASDAYFQNTSKQNGMSMTSSAHNHNQRGYSVVGGVGKNASSKSPEEFQKGVPGDVNAPSSKMIGAALLEDQNKNRLKRTTPTPTTVAPTIGNTNANVSSPISYTNTTAGKPEVSEISSSGGGGKGSSSHVEIDVDMTLSQPTPEEGGTATTASQRSSRSGSNEIIRNGQSQKTNGGGGEGDGDCTIIMNNITNSDMDTDPPPGSSQGRNHPQSQVQHNHHPTATASPSHFPPSCEKDLEILRNVRKVYVQLTDDNLPCYYKVSDESEGCLFETTLGDTNGSIWSRYFKQQQKVILVHDRNQRGVLKLEFGRSRTISCCQTLRFAAMTASFKLKPEEPLCIIFKDKECCVSCCCCPEATYETVPQLDSILPFSVFTKGRWKNRAELMVKHNDGTILGFIDKEQNSYSLTMGENLKPAMKACLIGFLIAMDVMDRQDSAGKFSFYLRPTTILLIILLLMLCITIVGYLLYHFSSMILHVKDDDALCGGAFDESGSHRTATVPHFNNDRTSDSVITSPGGTPPLSPSHTLNSSSSTSEFHFGSLSSTSSGGNGGDVNFNLGNGPGNNSSSSSYSSWAL